MAVPYKIWWQFDMSTLESYHLGTKILAADWTEKHLDICRLGLDRIDTITGGRYYDWHSIFRPKADLGFESLDGMDQIVDVEFSTNVIKQVNTDDHVSAFNLVQGFVNNNNAWAHRWVNGKYYNGSAAWDTYPPGQHAGYGNPTISVLDFLGKPWLHENVTTYMYSYKEGAGNGVEANRYQNDFFRGGAHFIINTLSPSIPTLGQAFKLVLYPMIMKVRYFNPIVNELSRYWVPTAGGVEVVLTGLGFDNDDDELDGLGDSRPFDWYDDFEDGVRNPAWNDDANNGTIVESGGLLTLAFGGGVNAEWGAGNAPYAVLTPREDIVTIETKLNSYTVNDDAAVGLYIHDAIDPTGGISFTRFRNDTTPRNGIMVWRVGVGQLAYVAVTTLPIWLRIVITGTRASATIVFKYSTDGISWTTLHTVNTEAWDIVALYAANWGVHNAVSAPFEYFGYDMDAGRWGDLVDVIELWKQSETRRAFWRDDFEATTIDDEWTTHNTDANRTISQAGGVLTIGIAADTDARWFSTLNKAPKLYRNLPADTTFPVEIITKVNPFTLPNQYNCGMFIGYHDAVQGGNSAYLFGPHDAEGENEGIKVRQAPSGAYTTITGLPDYPWWLKIRIDADEKITFWYSYDGSAWTQYQTFVGGDWVNVEISGYWKSDMEIGLFAQSLDTPPAVLAGVDAPFEFFEIDHGGSPYATLRRTDGDFTVDSNTQITIPANKFPALEAGNYILRLIKENMDFSPRNSSVDVWGWAGDFRTTIGGLVSEDVRISIRAEDIPPQEARERGGSIILMDIEKKAIAGGAVSKEYYSQDIVRAPDKVYEGIITEISSFRRGLDDRTGLFKIADCTVTLSNQNKKFSKILATHFFKDQIAAFYHAFIGEEENKKREIVRMVVEDYNIKGDSFDLILKDVSQKYLNKQLPRYICTDTELDEDDEDERKFPFIHDSFVGDPMPEILGLAAHSGEEKKGAIEAIYINTISYKYLAAAGFLKEITEVYSDNVLQTDGTHYKIGQDDKYTYIDFTGDQGENIITFNCKGYVFEGWNSDNDYIQNPAYIIGYVLIKLLGVPEALIHPGTIDALAAKYEAMGEGESGCLIIQGKKTATEVLRELLISCGAKMWISKEGKFKLGRKDETSLATDLIVFEQFDLLDSLHRKMGLKKVVTGAKVYWGFIPVHDVFIGSKEVNRSDLEDDYGGKHEDRIRIDRPRRRRGR